MSLVVPGFYATATISISALERFGDLRTLIDKYSGVATVVFLLVVLAVGLTAEEMGSRIETHLDSALGKRAGYEGHHKEWFDYLRLAFDKEPIGHRYLRSLVLRLKFELGMTVASVPFALGALLLPISFSLRSAVIATSLVFAIYFYIEARSSNKTLSELRREMLKKAWN